MEVAELVTAGRCLVLVIEEIDENGTIAGEPVGALERKDLNRSRSYLADLVMRRSSYENAVVYSCVVDATIRAAQLAKAARTVVSDVSPCISPSASAT